MIRIVICDVASEWMKHPPSDLFKHNDPEDWDETLRQIKEWIEAHHRHRKMKGKRKRKRGATGECCASCSVSSQPPSVFTCNFHVLRMN